MTADTINTITIIMTPTTDALITTLTPLFSLIYREHYRILMPRIHNYH